MKTSSLIISISACLVAYTLPAAAQQEAEPLFQSNSTVDIQLSTPWRDVQRGDEDESWPASLTWTDENGQQSTLELTVEQRGKSRLEKCSVPPIKLKFDKRVKVEGLFYQQKSLKLVTHCKNPEKWQQYYILEMLVYRIYNLVTDYSFRVRPFEITYYDTERDKAEDPRFAFVIEDDKAVARRHGLEKLKIKKTTPARLDPVEASRLALFQMMVGNVDWSPIIGPDDGCCHNVKLIGLDPETDPIIAIPYDFDATGLVDAPYAEPNAFLPVKSVRDRLYRGYCAHNATLGQARSELISLRTEILALFDNESRLNKRSRKKALKYIESFYELLNSDSEFEEDVVSQCRG